MWNKRSITAEEVVVSAKLTLNQWRSAQTLDINSFLGFLSPEDGRDRWVKPVRNNVKVNVEAAFF